MQNRCMRRGWFVGWVTAVVLSVASVSYGSVLWGVRGKIVPSEHHLAMPESGRSSGNWEGRDLTVHYGMSRDAGALTVSGDVRFANLIVYNYLVVRYFHLDLIVLDAEGKVLEMKGLVSTAARRSEDPIPFSARLTLPENAKAFAFSYRGEAQGDSDLNGSSPTYFWHMPIR